MNKILTQQDYEFIRQLVHAKSAIAIDVNKDYLIDSRLMILKEKKRYQNVDEILHKLKVERCEQCIRDVINIMTTNETSFFRDKHPFEALKTAIIPRILERKQDKTFTIWSGACSTGQEAYSLAMLLCESFPQIIENYTIKILATDISTDVLEQARNGVFTQNEVNRGLPIQYLLKYFDHQGQSWQMKEHIRNMIEFRQISLDSEWAFIPRMDLIFLRNVLIYFTEQTRAKIFNQLKKKIYPHGYLFLGAGETLLPNEIELKRDQADGTYFFTLNKEASNGYS